MAPKYFTCHNTCTSNISNSNTNAFISLCPKNNEYSTIFPTIHLLHEFIVGVWVTTKQAWLHWVKMNEATLKVYIYQGLGDTIFGNDANEEIKLHNLECRVICLHCLWVIFTICLRFQDFMAINHYYKHLNLLGLMITNLERFETKSR